MGFHSGPPFHIQDDRRNGVARLALRGELDLATAPRLETHLTLVEQDGVDAIVLDLRDLTFVDSTGLHTFLKARGRAADNGHRFALVGANDQVRRLLQVTTTEEILDEHESLRLLHRFTQRAPDPARASTSSGTVRNADG